MHVKQLLSKINYNETFEILDRARLSVRDIAQAGMNYLQRGEIPNQLLVKAFHRPDMQNTGNLTAEGLGITHLSRDAQQMVIKELRMVARELLDLGMQRSDILSIYRNSNATNPDIPVKSLLLSRELLQLAKDNGWDFGKYEADYDGKGLRAIVGNGRGQSVQLQLVSDTPSKIGRLSVGRHAMYLESSAVLNQLISSFENDFSNLSRTSIDQLVTQLTNRTRTMLDYTFLSAPERVKNVSLTSRGYYKVQYVSPGASANSERTRDFVNITISQPTTEELSQSTPQLLSQDRQSFDSFRDFIETAYIMDFEAQDEVVALRRIEEQNPYLLDPDRFDVRALEKPNGDLDLSRIDMELVNRHMSQRVVLEEFSKEFARRVEQGESLESVRREMAFDRSGVLSDIDGMDSDENVANSALTEYDESGAEFIYDEDASLNGLSEVAGSRMYLMNRLIGIENSNGESIAGVLPDDVVASNDAYDRVLSDVDATLSSLGVTLDRDATYFDNDGVLHWKGNQSVYSRTALNRVAREDKFAKIEEAKKMQSGSYNSRDLYKEDDAFLQSLYKDELKPEDKFERTIDGRLGQFFFPTQTSYQTPDGVTVPEHVIVVKQGSGKEEYVVPHFHVHFRSGEEKTLQGTGDNRHVKAGFSELAGRLMLQGFDQSLSKVISSQIQSQVLNYNQGLSDVYHTTAVNHLYRESVKVTPYTMNRPGVVDQARSTILFSKSYLDRQNELRADEGMSQEAIDEVKQNPRIFVNHLRIQLENDPFYGRYADYHKTEWLNSDPSVTRTAAEIEKFESDLRREIIEPRYREFLEKGKTTDLYGREFPYQQTEGQNIRYVLDGVKGVLCPVATTDGKNYGLRRNFTREFMDYYDQRIKDDASFRRSGQIGGTGITAKGTMRSLEEALLSLPDGVQDSIIAQWVGKHPERQALWQEKLAIPERGAFQTSPKYDVLELGRSAIPSLMTDTYGHFDSPDRANMTVKALMVGLDVIGGDFDTENRDKVKVAYMTLGGVTFDDGLAVSEDFAKTHGIQLGDKFTDLHGNKGTVGYIAGALKPEDVGYNKEVEEFFNENGKQVDVIQSPFSPITRGNAGTAKEAGEKVEPVYYAKDDPRYLDAETGEPAVRAIVGEVSMIRTPYLAESKTKNYALEDLGRARKVSYQQAYVIKSVGAEGIFNTSLKKSAQDFDALAVYLNALDTAVDSKGTFHVGGVGLRVEKDNETDQFVMRPSQDFDKLPDEAYVRASQLIYQDKDTSLNTVILPKDGGYLKLPIERIISNEQVPHDAFNVTSHYLYVLPEKYRETQEMIDGSVQNHAYTNDLLRIVEKSSEIEKYQQDLIRTRLELNRWMEDTVKSNSSAGFKDPITGESYDVVKQKWATFFEQEDISFVQDTASKTKGMFDDEVSLSFEEILSITRTLQDPEHPKHEAYMAFCQKEASMVTDDTLMSVQNLMKSSRKEIRDIGKDPVSIEAEERKQLLLDYVRQLKPIADANKGLLDAEVSLEGAVKSYQYNIGRDQFGIDTRSIKHNKIRKQVVAGKTERSSSAILTNDATVPPDTVRISPLVAYNLGLIEPKESIRGSVERAVKEQNIAYVGELLRTGEYELASNVTDETRILAWRDPVIHTASMSGFKFEIQKNLVGVGINPLIAAGFDADYDGDQLGLLSDLSPKFQNDLRTKISIERNLRNCRGDLMLNDGMDIAWYFGQSDKGQQLAEEHGGVYKKAVGDYFEQMVHKADINELIARDDYCKRAGELFGYDAQKFNSPVYNWNTYIKVSEYVDRQKTLHQPIPDKYQEFLEIGQKIETAARQCGDRVLMAEVKEFAKEYMCNTSGHARDFYLDVSSREGFQHSVEEMASKGLKGKPNAVDRVMRLYDEGINQEDAVSLSKAISAKQELTGLAGGPMIKAVGVVGDDSIRIDRDVYYYEGQKGEGSELKKATLTHTLKRTEVAMETYKNTTQAVLQLKQDANDVAPITAYLNESSKFLYPNGSPNPEKPNPVYVTIDATKLENGAFTKSLERLEGYQKATQEQLADAALLDDLLARTKQTSISEKIDNPRIAIDINRGVLLSSTLKQDETVAIAPRAAYNLAWLGLNQSLGLDIHPLEADNIQQAVRDSNGLLSTFSDTKARHMDAVDQLAHDGVEGLFRIRDGNSAKLHLAGHETPNVTPFDTGDYSQVHPNKRGQTIFDQTNKRLINQMTQSAETYSTYRDHLTSQFKSQLNKEGSGMEFPLDLEPEQEQTLNQIEQGGNAYRTPIKTAEDELEHRMKNERMHSVNAEFNGVHTAHGDFADTRRGLGSDGPQMDAANEGTPQQEVASKDEFEKEKESIKQVKRKAYDGLEF